MFGYVNINKQELKVKEYYKYKAYYCGLCHQLKKNHGRLGQMTLTYDMTFLVILLSSLYESDGIQLHKRCLAHPTQKHTMLINEISDYASDMNIALTYHKLLDDWKDDKSIKGYGGAKAFSHQYKKIEKKYPRQCAKIQSSLEELAKEEGNKTYEVDRISRPFGELMGELFVYKEDIWQETLRKLGFYLGKFIYLLDAYDDLEKDLKSKQYNPFTEMKKEEDFEEKIEFMLTSMMAECTNAFEKLPLVWDVELLRNILYAGVWKKYDEKSKQQDVKREEV